MFMLLKIIVRKTQGILSLFLLSLFALSSSVAHGEEPFIGVVEHPQCKDKIDKAVRLVFEKNGVDWVPFAVSKTDRITTRHEYHWVIFENGKPRGSLKIEEMDDNSVVWAMRDRVYDYYADKGLRFIPNKEKRFRGWCEAPVALPLVIVSDPPRNEPLKRKAIRLSKKEKIKAARQVIAQIPKDDQIRYIWHGDDYKIVPHAFKTKDILVYEAWTFSNGLSLVSLGADLKVINSQGPPEPSWMSKTYAIINKQYVFLGTGMEFIDAADFDSDGTVEYLFWYSQYNKDGYVLLYDDFRKKAEYLWSYH